MELLIRHGKGGRGLTLEEICDPAEFERLYCVLDSTFLGKLTQPVLIVELKGLVDIDFVVPISTTINVSFPNIKADVAVSGGWVMFSVWCCVLTVVVFWSPVPGKSVVEQSIQTINRARSPLLQGRSWAHRLHGRLSGQRRGARPREYRGGGSRRLCCPSRGMPLGLFFFSCFSFLSPFS